MTTETSVRERPIIFSGPMIRALLDGRKSMTRRVVKPQPTRSTMLGQPMWGHRDLGGEFGEHVFGACFAKLVPCPYGAPGDRLWVREQWAVHSWRDHMPARDARKYYEGKQEGHCLWYGAGGGYGECDASQRGRWRPSIHMPRWASRLTLEITDVRVQRLTEISEDDAIAEGFVATPPLPWWQGYRDLGGTMGLGYEQHRGNEPPEWMIEPKRMSDYDPAAISAAEEFRIGWNRLNAKRGHGWDTNPFCWALTFRPLVSAEDPAR